MEDYKKKYEEAFERARKINNGDGVAAPPDWAVCETIFPELKESEDEKIRKEIIQSIQDNMCVIHKDKCIAWLEKQGEQKPQGKLALEVWKDMRLEVYQQASGNRHEPNYSDDSTKMFSLTDIDEIIEKVAEKQCEQKTTNKIKPRFKVGDTIRPKGSMAEYTIESIYGECYHGKGWVLTIGCDEDYELVEQKPTDKVKPKFHEGEWVQIDRGNAIKILEVEEEIPCYKILNYYGSESIRKISDIDSIAHSWTIQDTKAGDVLADDYGIYIFEKFDECDKNCFVCNGAYQYSEKVFECEHMLCSTDVHPATKEQRDLLFQKMKEAGKEFNFNNIAYSHEEEIREKLEHIFPELKESDERIRKAIIKMVSDIAGGFPFEKYGIQKKKALAWLEKQGEQKPAWSEEDEYVFRNTYELVKENKINPNKSSCAKECLTWLKSIKERMKGE